MMRVRDNTKDCSLFIFHLQILQQGNFFHLYIPFFMKAVKFRCKLGCGSSKYQQYATYQIFGSRTSSCRIPLVEIYTKKVRLCSICSINEVGDEDRYIMIWPILSKARVEFLPKYFWKKKPVYKNLELVNPNNK